MRPERDVAGELALELEASLTALDTRKGPAKAYLESWAQQGTKGADGKVVAWKFQVRKSLPRSQHARRHCRPATLTLRRSSCKCG